MGSRITEKNWGIFQQGRARMKIPTYKLSVFSIQVYVIYRFLQGFHLEKFSLHGRQDGQGPGVHFTRITAGLSQSPNLLTILQVAIMAVL